uniref:Uncharacterized protein n=1 Tax=Mycena chlorophos TaxID=658473 RepID=A0ABQ0LR92_MYCCL|nr:predicted protein [Mycena chlorophos]
MRLPLITYVQLGDAEVELELGALEAWMDKQDVLWAVVRVFTHGVCFPRLSRRVRVLIPKQTAASMHVSRNGDAPFHPNGVATYNKVHNTQFRSTCGFPTWVAYHSVHPRLTVDAQHSTAKLATPTPSIFPSRRTNAYRVFRVGAIYMPVNYAKREDTPAGMLRLDPPVDEVVGSGGRQTALPRRGQPSLVWDNRLRPS